MPLKTLRSLLFLPATAEHLLAKATERGADALVIDLEDAIPPDRKAAARPMAQAAVRQLAERGATVVLRVNSDPALWQEDLRGMPVEALSAIMLPKVESLDQVEALAKALIQMRAEQAPPIAALIETPRGVVAAATIASHSALCALGFGSEDYAGALGVPAEPAALTWPAQQVLTCAHAHGLQCWGLAASIAEVDDMLGFARAVDAGRAMGFTGSVCIHPRQVPVVNRGFSPSEQELAWAQRVLAADQAAREQGLGAILLDGRMLDKPIVDRARRWLGLGV
ncbi:CoA ester lyase [Limnohabitans sp. Rim8]|uniref:HpcH/HpaI aldolase/citrate lyase family protein n=1 Tax=Limnohabitans sp. Rim8 TaxID=1100718 RepID=UPI0025D87902|nr:CoA ester lyase [Limnohabitans sp. Rim8]